MSVSQDFPLYDVAVLGCGPIGATLAGLLNRRGLSVLVIEKTTTVYPQPRAVGFDHDAMRLFQRIGVAEKLIPHIDSFRDTEYTGVDGQLIQILRREQQPFALTWEPNYTCDQPGVETVLRDHLRDAANVDLRFGHEVTAISQDSAHVRIDTRSASGDVMSWSARYAVGCDGAWSPTRESLGLKLETYDYDVSWMVVDVKVDDAYLHVLPDSNRQYCEPARPCSYIVCPGNHRRWEFMVLEGEDRETLLSEPYLWSLLGRWLKPGQAEILRAAPYQFHALVATEWHKARVFIAGDSAHQTPPFLGQGMCQGLRDAGNLEWKLAAVLRDQASSALLDSYVEERRPNVIETTLIAKERGRLISERDEASARVRDAELLRSGTPVTLVRQDMIPPLVGGCIEHDAPLAGRVFPQPRVTDAGGRAMLLDESCEGQFHIVFSALADGSSIRELGDAARALDIVSIAVASLSELDGARDNAGSDTGARATPNTTVAHVVESGTLVRAFLERHGCIGAIVRPDHYVFAGFRDVDEGRAMLASLKDRLAGTHEARSQVPSQVRAEAQRAEPFRAYLRASDDPKVEGIEQHDAYSWADRCLANPRSGPMFAAWRARLVDETFKGITSDGMIVEGLYTMRDESAPVDRMRIAVAALLRLVSPAEHDAVMHAIDDRARHAWMNPEVYMNRFGLRLDEIDASKRDAILDVLRASLSARGYEKARNLMRVNAFLGALTRAPRIMNEYSYNFNLFGTPSSDEPWGWNFYGHHLCLNCTVVGRQMVFTPLFMGAEPNVIDAGPDIGVAELNEEEVVGLELMRALPDDVRAKAQVYALKRDPSMPDGRVAIGDELLLSGAFQDNRVIPYEGVEVKHFPADCRDLLLELIGIYHAYLPSGPFEARMDEIRRHLDSTHFCWIGGYGDTDPFYYRIQSPVLIIEFDHHAGVFLSNTEPEKFHIHTLVRTPNGNDYGMALVKACCEASRFKLAGVERE
ncbi:bifunctional 3-(3-hydroxy-phenyl)propionate/3-hydroxycinnamic acid hydroxylase [Pararobbsia silviterrae]|uniref:Bifunctional 3-(3-hydroxy-phenyl)propionate/3-hydroxycinnamic acid hydroxylase n=1 Tax=Pararobbsia silviterrae TaxID=1792498 RepID=A0A494XZN0_9BURK|nr:bifunctional 3-(3-hydroxy-phenyl)propionate/3-hydroxycinnamic acid hydroxylase [Pararobbsia silviterrae]RKP53571.1 bifunctional 3-(3-hydroxy-phenyl)propionate/3-hydroxycinnamic acid hydroxylase [Pararobbsia silviterrae]